MPNMITTVVRVARTWACLPAIWLGFAIMPARMREQLLSAYTLGFEQQRRRLQVEMLRERAADFYRKRGR